MPVTPGIWTLRGAWAGSSWGSHWWDLSAPSSEISACSVSSILPAIVPLRTSFFHTLPLVITSPATHPSCGLEWSSEARLEGGTPLAILSNPPGPTVWLRPTIQPPLLLFPSHRLCCSRIERGFQMDVARAALAFPQLGLFSQSFSLPGRLAPAHAARILPVPDQVSLPPWNSPASLAQGVPGSALSWLPSLPSHLLCPALVDHLQG